MITSVKEILTKAREEGYAVGAFNTINMEITRAIISAARETHSPVIVQVTEKTMEYAGGRLIYNLIKNDAEFYAPEIPIGIHLDHGKSLETIEHCVEIGFTSVMYDGSRKKYEDNKEMTKKVVDFCHEKGIDVQGEVGNVPYLGEANGGHVDWDEYMTNPEEACEFATETGIDILAVAIGNAHGFVKERLEPDMKRLEKINKLCNIPLVLHGASDWENGRVAEVIKRGISCFNVDTSIRMAFMNSLINSIKKDEVSFDMRNLLGEARDEVEGVIKQKMKYFGSEGKA